MGTPVRDRRSIQRVVANLYPTQGSVRMNSGAGLVTDANFRNDVSGDGKVNHADISLTRTARGNSLP